MEDVSATNFHPNSAIRGFNLQIEPPAITIPLANVLCDKFCKVKLLIYS